MGNSSTKQQPVELPDIYVNYSYFLNRFSRQESNYLQAMDDLIERKETLEEKQNMQIKRERVIEAMAGIKKTLEEVSSMKNSHDDILVEKNIGQSLQTLQYLRDRYKKLDENMNQAFDELFNYDAGKNPWFSTMRRRVLSLEDEDKNRIECCICQEEFILCEKVEGCPYCVNLFHRQCINTWLAGGKGCPLCRRVIPPAGTN